MSPNIVSVGEGKTQTTDAMKPSARLLNDGPAFLEAGTRTTAASALSTRSNNESFASGSTASGRESFHGENRVSQRELTMNLIAGGLGTGMFSLPWSIAGASVIPGVLITCGVIFLNGWTVLLLVEAAEKYEVFDFGGVLGLLTVKMCPGWLGSKLPSLGTVMQPFANAIVILALFGSLIGYLIVMHDSAKPFMDEWSWWRNTVGDSRIPLVSIAALMVLPVCFVDQRYLSFSSTVALLVNIYLIVVLCYFYFDRAAEHELPSGACYLGFATGNVAMLAAVSQCIIIQMCVLPMYEELQDRSVKKFKSALATSFGALALIFCTFGTLGYLAFGPDVQSNVLLDLPRNAFTDVAQIGTIAVVWAIYPIMVIPMVAPVRNMNLLWLLGSDCSPIKVAQWRQSLVNLATISIVAISFIAALFIKELGIVNVIDGALCVGVFTSLGPVLVGLFLLDKQSSCFKVGMCVLLVFGLTMTVLGLIFNQNFKEELESSCIA